MEDLTIGGAAAEAISTDCYFSTTEIQAAGSALRIGNMKRIIWMGFQMRSLEGGGHARFKYEPAPRCLERHRVEAERSLSSEHECQARAQPAAASSKVDAPRAHPVSRCGAIACATRRLSRHKENRCRPMHGPC